MILNNRGLTLIELLATIVIIAILAAIAIPSTQLVISNQRDKAIISDIVQMVESSKIQVLDDACIDEKCIYQDTNSEIDFYSSRFNQGFVDFTDGKSPEKVMIWVDFNPSNFKGRKKDFYRELFEFRPDNTFSEQELLEVLNK